MLEIVNYNKEEYNFPALVVLGCFDAVHVGHAELLKKAKLQAKINGLDLGVMMFAEGKGGRQVFTFEERLAFLAGYNTKFVLKIDYTDEFKKTTAADFLHNLEEHINVKAYMSGKDFRFGAGAKGKSSTLKNYAEDEENGVWYMPVKDVMVDGEKVSTTLIKKYIEEGKIQKANALLGRQYFVTGEVCEGHGRGKTLGFPTANIVYPANKVLVKDGVYGVEAEIDGAVYRGVANCGPRPTFGEDAVVLEAYFEGLNEELYGKPVTIKFVNYIRGIKKFDSAEALSEQISRDLACIGAPDADAETEEAAPAAEVPAEVVAQTPAETVVEVPAVAVVEEPAAEPVETVVETPAATEPETATEVPAETAAAVPAEEPAVTEPEVAAETPVETVTEEPVPVQEEVPAEVPVEAAEEPAAEPEVAPAEEPVAREPVAPIEEAPAEDVKAEEVQPEPEQPAEEATVGEVTESDVSDPEGEIAVAAEPAEEEAVTKLVEEVFEEEEPEQPSDAEQPEVPAEVAESEEEPAETVEEEPSTEPEAATEEQAAEPVTEEQAAEEVSEEIAVSEDAEEVAESAEEPVEQPVCEPAEEPVTAPAAEEPACEPAEEESEEPAEESAEEEADEAETSEEEQEQEADQPAEQTSRKSKKRKRSRGKADRRRGDTRKR